MCADGAGVRVLDRCFTTDETQVPEGYDYVDIPAGDIAVCLLKGREDTGELTAWMFTRSASGQSRTRLGGSITAVGSLSVITVRRFTDP